MTTLTDRQSKPRVLYLTHDLPWPVRSGGRVREAETLRRLASRFDVHLVALCEPASDHHIGRATAERYGIRVEVFPPDAEQRHLSPLVCAHHSVAAQRRLRILFEQERWDVVHVEGHYIFNHLPRSQQQRALVVEHNVESTLLGQEAQYVSAPEERARLLADAASTRHCEREVWKAARVVGAVTDEDAETIAAELPELKVSVLPNGADHLSPIGPEDEPAPGIPGRLVFVGNFGYWPTRDAARVLVDEIFPHVLSQCPNASLSVVGYQPPGWLREAARDEPRVQVVGRVPAIEPWLDSSQVVICPLRIGGGVKVKVVEALGRGRAVVTTPVGMQGLRSLGPDVARECEDAAAMVRACVDLLSSPNERRLLQQRAVQAAHTLPTWDQASEKLLAIWDQLAGEATDEPTVAQLRS